MPCHLHDPTPPPRPYTTSTASIPARGSLRRQPHSTALPQRFIRTPQRNLFTSVLCKTPTSTSHVLLPCSSVQRSQGSETPGHHLLWRQHPPYARPHKPASLCTGHAGPSTKSTVRQQQNFPNTGAVKGCTTSTQNCGGAGVLLVLQAGEESRTRTASCPQS